MENAASNFKSVVSKPEDFSRSQVVTHTVKLAIIKLVIFRKR